MLLVDQNNHAHSCAETLSLTSMHRCWQFSTETEPHVMLDDKKAFTIVELDDWEDIVW